jgi:LacI family transcriptional regulator
MARLQRQPVGVIIQQGGEFGRNILRGVHAYVLEGRPWHVLVADHRPEMIATLARQSPAGLVAFVPDRAVLEAVLALGVPTVNVSGWMPDPIGPPRVRVDDEAIARRVAAHLRGRGLRHLAVLSMWGAAWAERRERAFAAALAEAGAGVPATMAAFPDPDPTAGPERPGEHRRLTAWLASLPKPLGLFAVNDDHAFAAADACRQAGLRIPADVALVGVDNDELLCELAWPPLSSVDPHTRQVGYEAARLLERLMAGEPSPLPTGVPVLVPSGEVIARQSSAVLAASDAEVAAAVTFIADHAQEGIDVSDVLAHVTVGRRSLEQRFRAALGRTVAAEIRRARIDAARVLLARTDLPVRAVARRCGFRSAQRFHVAFRQVTGTTPTTFRRASRAPG